MRATTILLQADDAYATGDGGGDFILIKNIQSDCLYTRIIGFVFGRDVESINRGLFVIRAAVDCHDTGGCIDGKTCLSGGEVIAHAAGMIRRIKVAINRGCSIDGRAYSQVLIGRNSDIAAIAKTRRLFIYIIDMQRYLLCAGIATCILRNDIKVIQGLRFVIWVGDESDFAS